ncbi:hypothetical protein MES5069_680085 [Mesorhizobium escarrei]|uniref:Uncharacterized protein n=1 Tax=Mesorhizobium escarrei TaxID=666018 RepID=A0ABN8KHW3_9HYPH|nr:hypothetical protein MES5069_680085 [Mesorhizobium escarrei]
MCLLPDAARSHRKAATAAPISLTRVRLVRGASPTHFPDQCAIAFFTDDKKERPIEMGGTLFVDPLGRRYQ